MASQEGGFRGLAREPNPEKTVTRIGNSVPRFRENHFVNKCFKTAFSEVGTANILAGHTFHTSVIDLELEVVIP